MKQGILFDLDGTLWDSGEGVAESWNEALAQLGEKERVTTEDIHGVMGKTMADIARLLFPRDEFAESMRIMDYCANCENEYLRVHGGTLYDGLKDVLSALKKAGFFLAIVSNCQKGYIEAFLEHHRLAEYFDDTENYGRTGQGKAYNIRLLKDRNHLDRAWYVGDTMGDYEATVEAGLPFIHAAYGFGTVPGGTPAVRDLRELPRLMESLRG